MSRLETETSNLISDAQTSTNTKWCVVRMLTSRNMADNLNADKGASRDDVKITEEHAAERTSQNFNVTSNVNTRLANP